MKTVSQNFSAPGWFLDEHVDDLDGTEPFVIRCYDSRLNQTLPIATLHQWEGQTHEETEAHGRFIVMACNTHQRLLDALDYLLEQTVDMDLAHGIGLTEGEADARKQALAIFAELDGNAS